MQTGGSPHLVVLTTVGGEQDARTLVRALVEDRIVACGTMVSAKSLFRWDGAISEQSEVLVVLKTSKDRWSDLQKAVEHLHPYEVPELIALPVEAGLKAYLDWIDGETSDTRTSP